MIHFLKNLFRKRKSKASELDETLTRDKVLLFIEYMLAAYETDRLTPPTPEKNLILACVPQLTGIYFSKLSSDRLIPHTRWTYNEVNRIAHIFAQAYLNQYHKGQTPLGIYEGCRDVIAFLESFGPFEFSEYYKKLHEYSKEKFIHPDTSKEEVLDLYVERAIEAYRRGDITPRIISHCVVPNMIPNLGGMWYYEVKEKKHIISIFTYAELHVISDIFEDMFKETSRIDDAIAEVFTHFCDKYEYPKEKLEDALKRLKEQYNG